MAMILHPASRQQPVATPFPASRTNHRRARLTRLFLRCTGRRLVAIESDPSIASRGHETQIVIDATESSKPVELLSGLTSYAAPRIELHRMNAQTSAPFQLAKLDDEDEEDDDLDEDDDLLDDEDDEDLDDDDDAVEDEEDEEEDEYEDLDDEDDEEAEEAEDDE